ncbi:PEP-CTERM sorting domain-containing protein [bacterium]|nr:PEP-CTERM sorting domain-containing protein [bacterium]
MRRIPGWVWGVGVAVALTAPGRATAGIWVSLAAGLPGASTPSAEADLWFDSPHAPPFVAVTSAPGTLEAGTAGGTVSFGGLATPLLLNLGDGSAYIAGGTPASDAQKGRGSKGGSAGARASGAPLVNAEIPGTAALLGLQLADPDATGARDLIATFTNMTGVVLATGTIAVPDGGYYVLNLGQDADPTPSEPTPTEPTPTEPTPTEPSPPVNNPGPVAAPEPSTLALMAVGGVATTAIRRLRGRKSA